MSTLIKDAQLVNEGAIFQADVLIKDQRIHRISRNISDPGSFQIDGTGLMLLPGCIDDQVHFREPGLTHKGDIHSESRAAVAGGITSFMEMPNTKPPALTQELLEQKYQRAAETSLANYSFYMGASNDNLEQVLQTDGRKVCGIKVFMGSSTGNMLVDDEHTLDQLFARAHLPIATHCEDEATIRANLAQYQERFGDHIPFQCHPEIRSAEACYISSSKAIALAKKHGTRLHVLHISTGDETELFDNSVPLTDKRITAEVCIHHLWFTDQDYQKKGSTIKWNPAVKSKQHQDVIWQALLDNRIDIIATDHAPHTWKEKQNPYTKAPSGGPLVQHALVAMLEFYHEGKISLETMVQKMCHNPAILFDIQDRGFIREGYFADLVLVNLNKPWHVSSSNVLAKCGWSPFDGTEFQSQIVHTLVSGSLVYSQGKFDEAFRGERMLFKR